MATRKSNQKALAKSVKSGSYKPSGIGAKARAAASKLKEAATGGKHRGSPKQANEYGLKLTPYGNTSIGKHSKEAAGGKHHAPSAQSAVKNAYGSMDAPARGRHSKEAHPNGNSNLTMHEAMSYRQSSRKKEGSTLSMHEAMLSNRQFTPSKARKSMTRAA